MNASIPNSFTRRKLSTYQRLHRRHELSLEQRQIAGAIRPLYCIREPDRAVEQSLSLQHPCDLPSIASRLERFEIEPYWMQHWPSAQYLDCELDRLLIELKLGAPCAIRALELGCGGGLLSVGLALRKMRVLASDYSQDALLLTKLNGYINQVAIETRRIDWRACSLGTYDLVIGADVVYDKSVFSALNACLVQAISATGVAIFAEPFRSMGDDFIDFLLRNGWFVQIREPAVPQQSTTKGRYRLIAVRHTRSP